MVPESDSARLTQLDNGLRVVTDQMDQVGTAVIGTWILSGARNETPGENGLAHFLEHMSFKGTDSLSAQDIARTIEERGGYMNASTGYESTAYYTRMLAEDAAVGFDIVADVLKHSVFASHELEREREVILQEIARNNDTPEDLVFDVYQQTSFPDQAIGRSILGTQELVQSFTPEHFRSFMGSHYQPDRMIVAAGGDVNHEAVVDWARKAFGSWPAVSVPAPLAADYQGGVSWVERQLDQAHIVIGFPSPSKASEDRYAARMLALILGGGMTSRLFQKVREEKGLVYAISSGTEAFRDTGAMVTYAGTTPDHAQEVLSIFAQEMGSLMTTITDAEIERARKQLRAGITMSLESTSARVGRLVAQLDAEDRLMSHEEIDRHIGSVDREQLSRLAGTMTSQPLTLSVVGPKRADLSRGEDSISQLADMVRETIGTT